MRRRDDSLTVPAGLDLDDALLWLVAHGASLDEVYAWWEAHEDLDVPDPRLEVVP